MILKGTVRGQFPFFCIRDGSEGCSLRTEFLIRFPEVEYLYPSKEIILSNVTVQSFGGFPSELCRNIFPAECHHLTNFKQSLSYNESHTKEKEGEACTMNFI